MEENDRWPYSLPGGKGLDDDDDDRSGAPNGGILAKYFKCHFLFLRWFQSFVKAYLCKLINAS